MWRDLDSIQDMFDALSGCHDAQVYALGLRTFNPADWERARERARNARPDRKAYKARWQREQRAARGLKRPARNGARAAGWAGMSADQKARHEACRKIRRAAQKTVDGQ